LRPRRELCRDPGGVLVGRVGLLVVDTVGEGAGEDTLGAGGGAGGAEAGVAGDGLDGGTAVACGSGGRGGGFAGLDV
jgi:hypothetical protein